MARCQKIITGTGAVTAALVAGGSASVFHGVSATSAEASAYFIKLYWEGTGTAPPTYGAQAATTTPTAGSTVASMTLQVNTTGLVTIPELPVNNGGRMWYWVSATAIDGAQTALTAGGDVITFIYD